VKYRYPTQLSISHSFLDIYEKGAFSGVRVNLIYLMKGYRGLPGAMTSSVPQYPGHRISQDINRTKESAKTRHLDKPPIDKETRQRDPTKELDKPI